MYVHIYSLVCRYAFIASLLDDVVSTKQYYNQNRRCFELLRAEYKSLTWHLINF